MPVSSFDEADLGQLYQALTLLDHPSAALTPRHRVFFAGDAFFLRLQAAMLQVTHRPIEFGMMPLHECSFLGYDWRLVGGHATLACSCHVCIGLHVK